MSTLKTTNIQNASSATTNIALDTSGNVTVGNNVTVGGGITASAGTVVMSSPYTMRNKIINGAMVIDQRNAGASITANDATFPVDRWKMACSQTSKLTAQQNAGSVTTPTGFTNYLGLTSSSAYTVLTGDFFSLLQHIEGFNVADLAWGTASAISVTLSFRVRSSLTGTFGGSLRNSAASRSYPFTYTISSANTWTQISVTIAGDTTGTWLTNSSTGIQIAFGLGVGATYSGTAGSWAAANYVSATGATSVVGTNGATFYITGVQLERGTVATPFEYRNYQQELAMCQRYFCKSLNQDVAPANNLFTGGGLICGNARNNAGNASNYEPQANWFFPVTMRSSPTITLYTWYSSGAAGQWSNSSGTVGANARTQQTGMSATTIDNTGTAPAFGSNSAFISATASAEL